MKRLVLTALLISVVGVSAGYTLCLRAEASAVSEQMAYAALTFPRFPSVCPQTVRPASNALCGY